MDAVADPTVREIVVMKSAQVGWTEVIGNVIGYHIDRDPAPILLIQPTLEMAEAWSKDRLAPMVRDTPALRGKIKDARARDSANTLLHKAFPGGHITIAGANSPAGLASRPIRVVLCDEVDRYPASAGTEGDPISLARKRSTTFWNRKLLMGSTPTVRGASRIEAAHEQSDKRRYMVPCVHCAASAPLEWPNVKWPEGRPHEAYYACPECGGVITDADKARMLAAGHWEATAEFRGVAGFHVSELYSPWVSFGQMARAFVDARGSPQTLQTWVNTSLGETWVERGDAPKWEAVAQLRRDYVSGWVPPDALALVMTMDVQKDRLIYVVRAWARGMTSWLVEHGEIVGDTMLPTTWQSADELLQTDYDGRAIRLALVDSGYRPDHVYAFARRHPGVVRATKGWESRSKPVSDSYIDITVGGKTLKKGLQLWHIDAGYFKDWVHGRLAWPSDAPGAWHLPSDASEDYCRQIVAESRISLPSGRRVWKRHERDNHYLDCEAMQAAGAHMLQIHRMRIKTEAVEAAVPECRAPDAAQELPQTVAPPVVQPPATAPARVNPLALALSMRRRRR